MSVKLEEIQHLNDKFSHFRGGRRVRHFFVCVPQVFSRCRCQLGPVTLRYSYISNQFRFLPMRRYSSRVSSMSGYLFFAIFEGLLDTID